MGPCPEKVETGTRKTHKAYIKMGSIGFMVSPRFTCNQWLDSMYGEAKPLVRRIRGEPWAKLVARLRWMLAPSQDDTEY